ncbi:hypothetical protein SLS54_007104 [Diplodia seriata]
MTTTSAAYDALRERTKAVKPDEPHKPGGYWVAVLLEGPEHSKASEQHDFLWIKANSKTKIKTIHNEYHRRYQDRPGHLRLQLGPTVPENTVSEDNLIVLVPVRTDAPTAPPAPTEVVRTSSVMPEPVQAKTSAALSLATPPTAAQSSNGPVKPEPFGNVPLSPALNGVVPDDQDAASEENEDTKLAPQNPFLQQLSSETDPEKLEKGVEEAVNLLEKLQEPLADDQTSSEDAAQWLRQIRDLKNESIRSRTVIGVVGNTGAGKSSVINALLDEERLVPTNCMRACTAVVTELSYNESDDAEDRYRADVEFIKPEEWYKELEILFEDLLDGSGNIRKEVTSNPDGEAGIAFAKIHAVYPHRTKESLAAGGLEALKRDATVNNILGTVKHIADSDNNKFYKKLQTYVDSQEKNTGQKKDKKTETKRM